MKRYRHLLVCLALGLVALFVLSGVAYAGSQYIQQIPAQVENKTCSLCHTANYPELNAGGKAWVAAGKDWSVFTKAAKPEAKEKPKAQETAKEGAKELPKTGANPYIFVAPGLAVVGLGLILGKRRPRDGN
jgi:LPXTG-motif cell wall-anchored protein